MKKYPDMTRLFAAKEARRRKLASLPIEEKMEIAQRLQEIGRQTPCRIIRPGRKRLHWGVTVEPKKKKYG
jgi:hypothetical protein